MVLSVWMLVDPTFYVSMAQKESDYKSGICILFLGGSLLFAVGFLGCFGAFKESQRLLVLVSRNNDNHVGGFKKKFLFFSTICSTSAEY